MDLFCLVFSCSYCYHFTSIRARVIFNQGYYNADVFLRFQHITDLQL